MTEYAATLEQKWEELKAKIEKELAKQRNRPNAESETRTRILLRSVNKELYAPYRDASLAAKKERKAARQ